MQSLQIEIEWGQRKLEVYKQILGLENRRNDLLAELLSLNNELREKIFELKHLELQKKMDYARSKGL